MIQRVYYKVLTNRLNEPVNRIQVLAGPRQVGKTTLVKQVLGQINLPNKYISADAFTTLGHVWLELQWNEARLLQKKAETPFVLAIDEIQKIHQWSEKVKQLWDEDRINKQPIHLILLGSSRLLLQQGLTESLAGRFEMTHIPHWRFSEMQEAFDFSPEAYAWFGAYPGAADLVQDEQRWKQYIRESLIETAISKDVLMLTRIDKPALLRSLFELGAQYSGQILSYTKVMGQLQDAGNTTTLAHYLRLLDGAGLLTGIPKYAGDRARMRNSSPRFQVFNNALMNTYKVENLKSAQENPKLWGRVVESCVGAYLLSYREEGYALSYYREGADEVDYILTYAGKTIAIEIKTSGQTGKGMDKFVAKFKPQKFYQISPKGISWQQFIQMHPGELF